MKIGVPKEIKTREYRVGLVPGSVRELTHNGHQVYIEQDAGAAIGYTNEAYLSAGAVILSTAEEIFSTADMIVKVKEPQPQECARLREGQVLFTIVAVKANLIGLLEHALIAVAGRPHQEETAVSGQRLSMQGDGLLRPAKVALKSRFKTKDFFDKRGQ